MIYIIQDLRFKIFLLHSCIVFGLDNITKQIKKILGNSLEVNSFGYYWLF